MAAYLLHALAVFDEVIFELIDRTHPKSILDIGSETGAFSQRMLAFAKEHGVRLTSVDPFPADELVRRATFDLVVGYSIPYLAQNGCEHDFVPIDGDHNH
jgi:predicted O-methyltransferase YrrM